MTDLPEELDPDLPPQGPPDLEERNPLGSIPRFLRSPSPSRPRRQPQAQETAQEGPSDPPGEPSSTASTEPPPPPPPPKEEEWVDPEDLQAAISQTVDVGFVLLGQGMGLLEARAKGLPGVDDKWVPTPQERTMVQEPAARIARRHVKAPATAMDTIDMCLIAAGVGSFAMRGLTGVAPLGDKHEP